MREHASKYAEFLDGRVYRLVAPDDITSPAAGLRAIRYAAERRGMKVRSTEEPGALVVQAYTPDGS